ncbi:hypothetical protein TIFTF001_042638, partial [Ficus carica]
MEGRGGGEVWGGGPGVGGSRGGWGRRGRAEGGLPGAGEWGVGGREWVVDVGGGLPASVTGNEEDFRWE